MTKKKHYIKTVKDIRYCEENGLTIYSEKRRCYWMFKNDSWCQFIGTEIYFYNTSLAIKDDELYYEEESEEQQEPTEKDVGKLCWFWMYDEKDKTVHILKNVSFTDEYHYNDSDIRGCGFNHCRPLTKEEIKEFMEKAEC